MRKFAKWFVDPERHVLTTQLFKPTQLRSNQPPHHHSLTTAYISTTTTNANATTAKRSPKTNSHNCR